jgi:hypothetical protein
MTLDSSCLPAISKGRIAIPLFESSTLPWLSLKGLFYSSILLLLAGNPALASGPATITTLYDYVGWWCGHNCHLPGVIETVRPKRAGAEVHSRTTLSILLPTKSWDSATTQLEI